MSSLISCSNCWYNGLQAGSIGMSIGYCAEHKMILRRSDETTCSRLLRKDLTLESAKRESSVHRDKYLDDYSLLKVSDGETAESDTYRDRGQKVFNGDSVSNIVGEYGEYGAKIESLAQLRREGSTRAEIAMLSLARGYTNRCIMNGGEWTSGLHLFWWTMGRLESNPTPEISHMDLRYQLPMKIDRQVEVAQWYVLMFRLLFISDIAIHAGNHSEPIGALSDLPECAAEDTEIVSLRKLRAWIKREAVPRIKKALTIERYRELADQLHQE